MKINIQNQMFNMLPPAKMYDDNIFLELYSNDFSADALLGFEAVSSLI